MLSISGISYFIMCIKTLLTAEDSSSYFNNLSIQVGGGPLGRGGFVVGGGVDGNGGCC